MRPTPLLLVSAVAILLAAGAWLVSVDSPSGDAASWSSVVASGGPSAKVDVNRAGREELERLPGITPQLAERIVKHRPYRKLDDLVTRKVLGRKQFARIREFVVAGPGTP